MAYIVHRSIHQPKGGRRLNNGRRNHAIECQPERRSGCDRRLMPDRRQANR